MSAPSIARLTGCMTMLALVVGCLPGTADAPSSQPRSPRPGVRTGGTVTVALERPVDIDPTNAHDPSEITISRLVCDTLVDFDPATGEPRPALAERWSVTDRGRRISFKLREGVRFHNGRELTSADVVFTLTRLASAEYASRSADILRHVAGYPQLHGDEDTDDERFTARLAGARTSGEYGVEIELSEPRSDVFRAFGHPATAPVPQEVVERDPTGFAQRPVCTGPYEVTQPWDGRGPIGLARFADYHGGNEAYTRGGAGWVDAVEIQTFDDRAQAAAAPDVDVAAIPEDRVPALSEAGVVGSQTPLIEYVGLPVSLAPFDDPAVRRALSAALDRAAIASRTADAPATGFLPSVDCDSEADSTGVALGGRDLKLYFNDEHGRADLAAAVATAWTEAFDLPVETIGLPWEAYRERGTRSPDFDGAFLFAWAPPYPSADLALRPVQAAAIGTDNWTRFASPDIQDAVEDAREAVAPGDRRDAWERAGRIACDQMPMIPVLQDRKVLRISDRTAFAVDPTVGIGFGEPVLREATVRS